MHLEHGMSVWRWEVCGAAGGACCGAIPAPRCRHLLSPPPRGRQGRPRASRGSVVGCPQWGCQERGGTAASCARLLGFPVPVPKVFSPGTSRWGAARGCPRDQAARVWAQLHQSSVSAVTCGTRERLDVRPAAPVDLRETLGKPT